MQFAGFEQGPESHRAERVAARAGLAIALIALASAAGGCDLFEDDSSKKVSKGPYSTSTMVIPANVTTSLFGAVDITASIPESSVAMGIAAFGTDTDWKLIEHAGLFLGGDQSITGPKGPVPLSFNIINGDPFPSALSNEAVAVHFPNDGSSATLKAGDYRFPVAAARSSDGFLTVDTLQSRVFYKVKTSEKPTLKLNVFVLRGVSSSITSDAGAQSDPEVLGAVAVLRNVYANNPSINVIVDLTVRYLDDTVAAGGAGCLAVPGTLTTEAEQFCLLRSYPRTPTNDAMNIFIITSLDYLDPNGAGTGVIGLAAAIPGPFNLQGFASSGTLAEYQGDSDGTVLGFTLAHEFGHFLGLFHTSQTNDSATSIIGEDPIEDTEVCTTADLRQSLFDCPDFGNLMFPYVDSVDDPPVTAAQGNVVKYNPGVTLP